MTKKELRKRAGAAHPNPLSKFKHDYSKDYADPKWPYHHGGMDRGAKIVLIVFPLAILSGILYVRHYAELRDRVITPLDVPKIIGPLATSAAEDPARFWGSYRSGLYFGIKSRTPKSPVFGKNFPVNFVQ